jgi:hypothetical protein
LGLNVWVERQKISAAHARVIAHQPTVIDFVKSPSTFTQFQALYDVGLCLLYGSFRFSVSIIFGVHTIEALYAVENDSDDVIAPQIPGRFLYGLSWCFPCPSYEQSGVG